MCPWNSVALMSVNYYAASSKDAFLKEGVLDTVVNVLNVSSDANVVMKAIGCLRLLCKTEGLIHALI